MKSSEVRLEHKSTDAGERQCLCGKSWGLMEKQKTDSLFPILRELEVILETKESSLRQSLMGTLLL